MKKNSHRSKILSMLTLTMLGLNATSAVAEEFPGQKLSDYRNTVKALGGALKAELGAGMKAGGPMAALAICNDKAATITDDVSKKQTQDISRISLKPRNPKNTPDKWEMAMLKDFEQRKAKGEDPVKMEASLVTEGEAGYQEFRYMKAIPTQPVCLKCHGTEIPPNVQKQINALYPDDKATGFKAGDIRGAFSVHEVITPKQ
ncbi:Tll0287-like domain-containing protein [Candidatus Venteria ishoeyi]|uniref:Tll0287-like domain-containing protein n=1 Tax=Candidatus Venteria ishoeyi TaxID=1899563 RepID=A0A1H6FHD3_9GAMM|nr:DUF3365 domain-containing protein [Candidatus Venteria ishoeyi]MDM8545680.1 DUF3365 domain-containing protein [Candidatus Venteria ishoeyi]SEH09063.1 Uncharacterised protein [Candidatus Venteria ishoeyi]